MKGKTLGVALLVVYSVAHFVYSGLFTPLQKPNLRQIAIEMRPIAAYVAGSGPVTVSNPRQYGPTFFFVMDPLLRVTGGDPVRLSHLLYALEATVLLAAFCLTLLALRRWKATRASTIAVALLWLNFSPLYYLLGVKGVEGWELCLMAGALHAMLIGRRWIAGACIAAATLTKMLPGMFLLYFLFRDRRAFVWTVAFLAILLSLAHAIYGPEIGWRYPGLMWRATHGRTWALTYHENVSLKGMIVKAFGRLQAPTPGHVQVVDPDPETGYWVAIDDRKLAIANALGQAAQAILLAGLVWLLTRRPAPGDDPTYRTLWEWSLVAGMMLIISPQTAFEYMLLALTAFSFVVAAAVSDRRLWRRAGFVVTLGAALLLVANVLPRQLLNRLLPITALVDSPGYRHLTLSEAYQYFGFPFFGMVALVCSLWLIRPGLRQRADAVVAR